VCGDSERQPGEQCDDGNAVSGDGCSATCLAETSLLESEPNDDGTLLPASDFTPFVFDGPLTGDALIVGIVGGFANPAGPADYDDDTFALDNPKDQPVQVRFFAYSAPSSISCELVTWYFLRDALGQMLSTSQNCAPASVTIPAHGRVFLQVLTVSAGSVDLPYQIYVDYP
jgi:cysteine-rich repeat protein